MALNHVFDRCVDLFPDELAFAVQGGRDYTYDVLEELSNLYGHSLLSLGVQRGDRICIATPNNELQYILNITCQKIGAVYCPVNFILEPHVLLNCINLTESSVLFFHPKWTNVLPMVKPQLKHIKHFIQMQDEELEEDENDGFYTFEQFKNLAKGKADKLPLLDLDENDTAFIVTTMGTTDLPKAVMTTHRNTCAVDAPNFSRYTTFVCTTPFFHESSLYFSTKTLVHGGAMVMLESFDPDAFLEAVSHHEANGCFLIPAFMETLIELAEESEENMEMIQDGLKTLRICMHAGAPCADEISSRFGDIIPKCWISDVYGITECSGIITYQTKDEQLDDDLISTVGAVVPFHLLRIVDVENGNPYGHGKEQTGEIQIKGPAVFKGFYKDPKATAEVMTDDGFYKTGDLGSLESGGRLYIKGRVGEEIKEDSGEDSDEESDEEEDITVYHETDKHLSKHKYVDKCISIGIPLAHYGKKVTGEQIESFVVTIAGKSVSKKRLTKHLRDKISQAQMPVNFHFVSELPTVDGEVDCPTLKKRFLDGTLGLP